MRKIAIVNKRCYLEKNKIHAELLIKRIKNELGADVVFTEHPGHAEKIAKESAAYDIIIAAGGDGTVSQVVNGMNLNTQALAIIPFGTGNSLAHDLDIRTLAAAIDIIKNEERDKIDLLECSFIVGERRLERYIVTTSGTGFAYAVASFGDRYLKIAKPLSYILSACLKSFNQNVASAKIQLDGSSLEDIEFTNFFINNTRYSANTCVFPRADLRDSALNLLVTKTNALTQYLWNIGIITRTYFYYPGEKTANRLRIILHKPSSFMLDGEVFNSVKEINYSVISGKLNILV